MEEDGRDEYNTINLLYYMSPSLYIHLSERVN